MKEQNIYEEPYSNKSRPWGKKGRLKELCDVPFCVDSDTTARIQEVHILLAHILCDLTERILFNE